MNKLNSRALFVAASVLGFGVGQTKVVKAVCSCLPTSRTQKIEASQFQSLGAVTYGWDASLESDELYTFGADSGASGYADFKTGTGTGAAWATVCRISYQGNSTSCTGSSQNFWGSLAGGTFFDKYINFSGAISSSNSIWDYYKVNLAGSQSGMGIIGVAAIAPQPSCW